MARIIAGTGLTPQARTTDKKWNAFAEAYYRRRTSSRFAYDIGGRYNAASSQFHGLRFMFRDGDCAQVPVRDSVTGAASFAFYEGHQIGNHYLGASGDAAEWRDGVLHDRMNRAITYRFLGDEDTHTDLPSSSVFFLCDYQSSGKSRGLSALSHAINHLCDASEITTYIKTGVKLSNRHGYWIETATGADAPPPPGVGSRVTGANAKQIQVRTGAGPVVLERIFGAGEMPSLGPGQSIKFNTSSNPHPNQLTLLDYLIRDVSWGLPWGGVSPEMLWNITALGGANTRFVMADAQQFVDIGQQFLVDSKCQPEYNFIIATGLANGDLPPCADPEWWKCVWIRPPRITVDFGKDGRLYMEQVKSGALTFSRLYGWQGLDVDTEQEQWLEEMATLRRRAQDKGLDPDRVTDMVYGRSGVTTAQPANGETPKPTSAEREAAARDDEAEDPAETEAVYAELVKKPALARAVMERLRKQPTE
jgi:capsid protein